MSRFVRFDHFGGLDQLEVVDVEPPTAGPGQVRVRVHAAGLNPVDWKLLAGGPGAERYGLVPPSGNGNDFSGVIDQVGAGIDGYSSGDAVFGGRRFWAQADFVVIDAELIHRMPDGLPFEQAGALDIAGRTAVASVESQHLGATDTVLVSAAAGGVGVLAAQLALRTGATVIGTASTENHEFLRELGVIPVEYGPGLADRVRAIAPSGITAVLDNNGAETIDAALELGVPAERINTITMRGRGGLPLGGIGGAEATRGDLARLAALIAEGDVLLPIDSRYALEEVIPAYQRMMAGHLRGKIVLVTE